MKVLGVLGLICFITLLVSSIIVIAQEDDEVDMSKLGFQIGENFTFEVVTYSERDSDSGYYLGFDNNNFTSIYAAEGQEFTINVTGNPSGESIFISIPSEVALMVNS